MRREDTEISHPYGYPIYSFYAVAKASGVLHYADTYEHHWDDDGELKSFNTVCGRTVNDLFSPGWRKKWTLISKGKQVKGDYKRTCLKCRKIR